MRDIRELLIILKKEILNVRANYRIKDYSMCLGILRLNNKKEINKEETDLLENYLLKNKPEHVVDLGSYWWDFRIAHPRINFLDNLIESLS